MLCEITKGMSKEKVLKWKAQDGWSPLCDFLDKDVPNEDFPNRNALEEVVQKVVKSLMQDANEAYRNMGLFIGCIAVGTATLIWKYY
jgi:uncharacterized membrane-anchored protein YjiN (DUF445 family)